LTLKLTTLMDLLDGLYFHNGYKVWSYQSCLAYINRRNTKPKTEIYIYFFQ